MTVIIDAELAKICKPPVVCHVDEFYDIYIGRKNVSHSLEASKWANPYSVKQFGREGCIEHFEAYLRNRPDLMEAISELRGKRIACWCHSTGHFDGALCHGDILVKVYFEWARKMIDMHGLSYFVKGSHRDK